MVQKITQTIDVYDVSFQIEVEQALSAEQRQLLVDSFFHYPANVLKILSQGRSGESPLKIVIAEKGKWETFGFKKNEPQKFVPTAFYLFFVQGFCSFATNTIFLKPDFYYGVAVHEIAHAIDDFATTRFNEEGDEVGLTGPLIAAFTGIETFTDFVSVCANPRDRNYQNPVVCNEKSSDSSKIRQWIKNYPHISKMDPQE